MITRYSDFVQTIKKDTPKNTTPPQSKVEEGFITDFVKKRIGVFSNEYITEEDAEFLKYGFLNIYVDSLSALIYSKNIKDVIKSVSLKPDNIMKIIQQDLKYLIQKQKGTNKKQYFEEWTKKGKKKKKEMGVDIVYTGFHKNGTNFLEIIATAIQNVNNYIKHNIDSYIDKYFSTNVLSDDRKKNTIIANKYKELFNNILVPVDGEDRNRLEILGALLVKKIKEEQGLNFENMVVDDTKQKENKYLKNKKVKKQLEEEVIDNEEAEEIQQELVGEIEKEDTEDESTSTEVEKEVPKTQEPTPSKSIEPSESLVTNVIDRYCDFNGITNNRIFSSNMAKEIKSIYATLVGTGSNPTEDDIFDIINRGNTKKEKVEPKEVVEPTQTKEEPETVETKEEVQQVESIPETPTKEFVDSVFNKYLEQSGFLRNKRLEMGITADINRAYSKIANTGVVPTEEDILKEIIAS